MKQLSTCLFTFPSMIWIDYNKYVHHVQYNSDQEKKKNTNETRVGWRASHFGNNVMDDVSILVCLKALSATQKKIRIFHNRL